MKMLHKLVGLVLAVFTIFVAVVPASAVGKTDNAVVQDVEILEEKARTEISYTE